MAEVELVISGLGEFSAPSVGTLDFDIAFGGTLLTADTMVCGNPFLGNQLDLFGLGSITDSTASLNFLHIFELSLDTPA